MTQTVTPEMPGAVSDAGRLVRVREEDQARLHEAMALMGESDPEQVLSLALEELLQRQRFLALVERHERTSSSKG